MVYDDIIKYLGQQNFAAAASSNREMAILFNREQDRGIYLVVIDSGYRTWGLQTLESINRQLIDHSAGVGSNEILFIVVSKNPDRDKYLAGSGLNVWIADTVSRRLMIYENQPDDFFGIRQGIEQSLAGQAEAGAAKDKKNFPTITVVLVALNVAYFLVTAGMGKLGSTNYMLTMGANNGALVFKDFQLWRLVTSMFMHFSLQHLAGNMIYLAFGGYSVERSLGHVKFLLLYMLSGIGASLVSAAYYYLTNSPTVSAGASGAVYGLLGALIYLTFFNRGRIKKPQVFARLGMVLFFIFYSNFVSDGVDIAAHIAGLIFGFLLCIAFIGGKKNEKR